MRAPPGRAPAVAPPGVRPTRTGARALEIGRGAADLGSEDLHPLPDRVDLHLERRLPRDAPRRGMASAAPFRACARGPAGRGRRQGAALPRRCVPGGGCQPHAGSRDERSRHTRRDRSRDGARWRPVRGDGRSGTHARAARCRPSVQTVRRRGGRSRGVPVLAGERTEATVPALRGRAPPARRKPHRGKLRRAVNEIPPVDGGGCGEVAVRARWVSGGGPGGDRPRRRVPDRLRHRSRHRRRRAAEPAEGMRALPPRWHVPTGASLDPTCQGVRP